MDGFTQPEGALESLGFPPEMAGRIRRRGIWPALANTGQEADDRGQWGSERQPRLLQAMNEGESGQASSGTPPFQDPGMSAPESTYSVNGRTRLVDAVQNNRIEDDKTRHPYGDTEAMTPPAQASPDRPAGDFSDQAPQMAQSLREAVAQHAQQSQQPEQDPYAPLPGTGRPRLRDAISGAQANLAESEQP